MGTLPSWRRNGSFVGKEVGRSNSRKKTQLIKQTHEEIQWERNMKIGKIGYLILFFKEISESMSSESQGHLLRRARS